MNFATADSKENAADAAVAAAVEHCSVVVVVVVVVVVAAAAAVAVAVVFAPFLTAQKRERESKQGKTHQ